MKSKILIATFLMASLAIVFSDQAAMTKNNGSPGGYTGSPNDGRTCGTNGGCHGGGSTFVADMITTDIPDHGYTPGETYSISATVSHAGRSKFGFELSEEDSNGNKKGTLIATTATQLKQSGKSITHKTSSTAGTDTKTWTFDWTAPAQGSGEVNFYAAFNASNSMNNTGGDIIYHSSLTIQEGWPAAVESLEENQAFNVWPNPTTELININLEGQDGRQQAQLFSMTGQRVATTTIQNGFGSIDATKLDAGVYMLQVEGGAEQMVKRVVVR